MSYRNLVQRELALTASEPTRRFVNFHLAVLTAGLLMASNVFAITFDIIPARVVFQAQALPSNHPAYRYDFLDPTEACEVIATYRNGLYGIYYYTNPRGWYHPVYAWGCTYDIVYRQSGTVYPNLHYQNWVTPRVSCVSDYDAIAGTFSTGQNPGGSCRSRSSPSWRQLSCGLGNPINPGVGIKLQRRLIIRSLTRYSPSHGSTVH